jgi:sarcosine oxidase delta subunit
MSGKPTKLPAEKESGGSAPIKTKASKESPKPSAVSFEKFDSALRHFLNSLVGIVIAGFVFGCLVSICQPPENLPAPHSGGSGLAVMQVIAQAKASRGSDVAELSQVDVNDYLAQRTAPRGFLFNNLCRFDGVIVSFQPKVCRVFTRYSIFGYPIYLSGAYTARDDFGRPAFDNRGGAIGRLSIAPVFMGIIQYPFFGELWNGFGIERETLNQFRSVEFEQGVVRLLPDQ